MLYPCIRKTKRDAILLNDMRNYTSILSNILQCNRRSESMKYCFTIAMIAVEEEKAKASPLVREEKATMIGNIS